MNIKHKKTINFYDTDWYEIYTSIRNDTWNNPEFKTIMKNNNSDIKFVFPPNVLENEQLNEFKSKKTALFSHFPYQKNCLLLHVESGCYDIKSQTLFVNDNTDIKEYKKDYIKMGPTFSVNHYKYMKIQKAMKISYPNIYLPIVTYAHHITHFIEVYNFFLHYIHNPQHYNPINYIFLSHLNMKSDYPWIVSYLNALLQNMPSELHTQIISFESIEQTKQSLFCFDHLNIVGKVGFEYNNGINYVTYDETNYLRVIMYKSYEININKIKVLSAQDMKVIFYIRENGKYTLNRVRSISNIDEVKHILKLYKCNVEYTNIENFTFGQQIQLMVNTDIFITVTGGALTNCIFMLPQSGVISIFAPYNRDNRFETLCTFADLNYFPLFSENNVHPSKTCYKKGISSFTEVKIDDDCLMNMHITPTIVIDKFNLLGLVRHTKEIVYFHKYRNNPYYNILN